MSGKEQVCCSAIFYQFQIAFVTYTYAWWRPERAGQERGQLYNTNLFELTALMHTYYRTPMPSTSCVVVVGSSAWAERSGNTTSVTSNTVRSHSVPPSRPLCRSVVSRMRTSDTFYQFQKHHPYPFQNEFNLWFNGRKHVIFDHNTEQIEYCKSDVMVLMHGFMR